MPRAAQTTPDPPSPADPFEAARWDESRRRRRLLEGTWRADLVERLEQHLGTVRRQAWGVPSLAINPFRNISRELAVLYDRPPAVSNDAADVERMVENVQLSGLWGMMSRVQAYTVGLREMLIRAHVDARGRLRYRQVSPDLVLAGASPDIPDRPVVVHEFRLRQHPTKATEKAWTVDVLDVSDPENPIYEVHEALAGAKLGENWSQHFLGSSMSGEAYPYRRNDGRPVLPYVLHHAQRLGDRLWDSFEGSELVDASLDLAVLHCMLVHTYRDASWPQRYVLNAQPAGMSITESGDGRRAEVISDPASLLVLETIESDGAPQPMIGQWKPGGDVAAMEETLSNMVARVATDAGVPPSDVQRLGGTARSGAAISLTNEGKRQAQRRYAGQFRDTDERLMMISAIMLNRATGTAYPEGGYNVRYLEIPLSPDELKARRDHVLELTREGLMSPIQAYQEIHPGTSKQAAEAAIREIGRGRALMTLSAS